MINYDDLPQWAKDDCIDAVNQCIEYVGPSLHNIRDILNNNHGVWHEVDPADWSEFIIDSVVRNGMKLDLGPDTWNFRG